MITNYFSIITAESVDINDRHTGENKWHQTYDENIDNEQETRAVKVSTKSIPSKLKATIKFGYDEGLKADLTSNGLDFESWISDVFPHVQARFAHPSLGTEIEFEVCRSGIIL